MSSARLVVLTGGHGAAGFASRLAHAHGPTTLLVNAYDDGRSTGRLRRHFDVLGPSDPAKLIVALANDVCPPAARILARRLPLRPDESPVRALLMREIADPALPAPIAAAFEDFLQEFLAALARQSAAGRELDLGDLAIRNVVLLGAAFAAGGFQAGIDALCELLGLSCEIVLVSTRVARVVAHLTDGTVVDDEPTICLGPLSAPIARVDVTPWSPPADRAVERVRTSAAIVYAPGTLYSSLVPTVLLVGDALRTVRGPKIMVGNLAPEADGVTLGQGVAALAAAGSRYRKHGCQTTDWVTHLLIDAGTAAGGADRVAVGSVPDGVSPVVALLADPTRPGCHDATRLVDEIGRVLGDVATAS